MNRHPHPDGERGRNVGAIIQINLQLLYATVFAGIAWISWPSVPEWWGLGLLSIMCGMGAAGGLVNALSGMVGLYRREQALADYMAQGGAPKSARMASQEELRRAGMIE